MSIYIKGGKEDAIAFFFVLVIWLVAMIVCEIKWWWDEKKER